MPARDERAAGTRLCATAWRLARVGAAVLCVLVGAERVRAECAPGCTVGQWERFDASVTNPASYADPYADVTLEVTYTRPDGSTVPFVGFYDGGMVWRIRFMPDQLGVWRYDAAFTDGGPGISGTFTCVPSATPGKLVADPANPLWFAFAGGVRTVLRSLHVGDRFLAANWAGEKRAAFLDWAQGQGYNMLSIASHYLNREAAGRGRDWDTPDLWPLDAVAYRQLEVLLDDLADRAIIVYPFAGFFGRDSNFPTDPTDQHRFISYTLARLGPYWNVMLNVGGPEPNLDDYLSPADVERLGGEIRAADVFGHPLAVHNKNGDDPYRDSPWSSYGILHGPKTTDRGALSAELLENHHPAKPLYAQETLWPGNENHPAYTDDDVRKNAFVLNMSATVLNFGDMDGNSSSGFSGSLNLADRVQSRHDIVKRVWDFFAGVPFYRMRPCQDAVTAGFCLGEAGREYLVYLEAGGSVDVAATEGTYRVEWINARDTTDVRLAGTTTTGHGLAAPDDEDWLLRLLNRALLVSAVPDRSDAVALDGAAVAGEIRVFVDPPTDVEHVRLELLDGTGAVVWTDAESTGTGHGFDTTAWSDGTYLLQATVELQGGGSESIRASFTVANHPPLDQGFDQVHLAWVDDPATTLAVVWRTAAPASPSLLEFREAGESAWRPQMGTRRPSGTTGTLHQVDLAGLMPDTTHEYRLRGDDGAWSPTFTTRTAPLRGGPAFDAIYVADTGLTGRLDGLATGTAQVVAEIARLDPHLVLLGGDYAYFNTDTRFETLENTIDAWFNQMGPVAHRSIMMPSYGNHEALLGEDVDAWVARFPTPPGPDGGRNYSFDVGDAHFMALFAVENGRGLSRETLDWIAADLAAARADGQQWLIPFFHVSPFADGDNHSSNRKLRAQLGPIFEEYGVQVALASHDQSYERTFPLTDVPATDTPTSTALRCYGPADGVTWVKVSPGGKLSNLNKGFSQFQTHPAPAWTAVRDNTMHHFARLTVSGDETLRVETYGVAGDGTPPILQDAFEYRTGSCDPELRFGVAAISFTVPTGAMASHTVELFAAGAAAVPYEMVADARWLAAAPAAGSTPAAVDVVVDATNLLPGTYAARLTADGLTAFPDRLSVTLTVTGADGRAALLASRAPDRSRPFLLHDEVVDGDLFAFVEPAALVTRVRFFVDGESHRTENKSPFDLAGTVDQDRTAHPFGTTKLEDGSHTISGLVTFTDGSSEVVHATFDVSNDDPCRVACHPPCECSAVCGDGVRQSSEACDDAGETATCDADCTTALCGDAVTNATAGEMCDTGGQSGECDADCTLVACGDGMVNASAGEICDDAGESATCDEDCTPVTCGDGIANATAGETCDAGAESAFCDIDCTMVACGDGMTNVTAGESCDTSGESSICDADCSLVSCGDGTVTVTAGEACDAGGESVDCDRDCSAAQCGDGVINVTAGEACDGAARGPCAGLCGVDCRCAAPGCGDGVVQAPEACDAGADNSDVTPDACRLDCRLPSCGDGVADAGEECDEGGVSGACTADCTAARCGDEIISGAVGEECDGRSMGVCHGTCDAECQCSIGSPRLLLSVSPDRADAVPLHGASVDGDVHVFLVAGIAITRVEFYLDDPDQEGRPMQTEGKVPYDLMGTRSSGNAAAYDTTKIDDGAHIVHAVLEFPDGQTGIVAAMFYVANDEPALAFGERTIALAAAEGSGMVSQAVTLTTTDGNPAPYVTTLSAAWLDLLPASGTTPDTTTVVADVAGLSPGVYADTISVSAPGYVSDALIVTLHVGEPTDCVPVACADVLVTSPYVLTFDRDHGHIPDGLGAGTGFTYVDPPSRGAGYVPDNLQVDHASGALLLRTTAGLQYQGANTLDNALGVGVDAREQAVVLTTTLVFPPVGAGRFEQAGLWFGNHEDSYVKLVVLSTPSGTKVQYLLEIDGEARAEKKTDVLDLEGTTVLLQLRVDPATSAIDAAYLVDDGPLSPLRTFTVPPELFGLGGGGGDSSIGTQSFGGVFASHRGAEGPLVYSFDAFAVDTDPPFPSFSP
jgi:hypothetical protein